LDQVLVKVNERSDNSARSTMRVTVITELGDITRFANPRRLMAYLGLVPSEHSSGAHAAKAASRKPGTARPGE
jgi:transposase